MTTPPQRLGAYEVIGKLASGGMATTYVARKTGEAGFERLVVLKRVHPHLLFDPSLRDALRDEARLAGSIHHPNVVTVEDVVTTQGELCLVMPYVESLSLGELLGRAREAGGSENQRIPAAVASRVLLSVLAGLEAAHEAKDLRGEPLAIVHRDVSPRNVLVGSDGEARLIDFGIAKAKGRMSQTTSGIMKGTLAYMSPEQLRRREIDRRTDVFAAGAVLFEALTGERLFDGRDEADVLIGVLAAEVRPLEGEIEGATSALDDVLSRALERDPDERFPTAAAFSEALERALPPAPAREVAALVERLGAADLGARREAIRVFLDRTDAEPTRPRPRPDEAPALSRTPRAGRARVVLALAASLAGLGALVFAARSRPAAPNVDPATFVSPQPSAEARPAAEIALDLDAPAAIEELRTAGLLRAELDGRRARLWVSPWSGTLIVEARLSGGGTALARFEAARGTSASLVVPKARAPLPLRSVGEKVRPGPKASPLPPDELQDNPYR